MITENIFTLVNYGIAAGLLDESDRIYTTNTLMELFGLPILRSLIWRDF